MNTSQSFDYDRPSRDTLFGVYVEASDENREAISRRDTAVPLGPDGKALPSLQDLFGLMLTVDDRMPAEPAKEPPQTPKSGFSE